MKNFKNAIFLALFLFAFTSIFPRAEVVEENPASSNLYVGFYANSNDKRTSIETLLKREVVKTEVIAEFEKYDTYDKLVLSRKYSSSPDSYYIVARFSDKYGNVIQRYFVNVKEAYENVTKVTEGKDTIKGEKYANIYTGNSKTPSILSTYNIKEKDPTKTGKNTSYNYFIEASAPVFDKKESEEKKSTLIPSTFLKNFQLDLTKTNIKK